MGDEMAVDCKIIATVVDFCSSLRPALVTEDVLVPAGSSVVVCIQHLHMDPEFFPEPHKFIPERFLPDKKLHPFSYIPFSAGPRNCIGT
jgi:cytochrome P450